MRINYVVFHYSDVVYTYLIMNPPPKIIEVIRKVFIGFNPEFLFKKGFAADATDAPQP